MCHLLLGFQDSHLPTWVSFLAPAQCQEPAAVAALVLEAGGGLESGTLSSCVSLAQIGSVLQCWFPLTPSSWLELEVG